MKFTNLIIISILVLLNNLIYINLQAQINNGIEVKVGNLLITSIDVQNEIITNLVVGKKEVTQENINNSKNYAVKNLISKSIKKSEIDKYQIEDYQKKDLQNYILNVAKKLNTDQNGLKEIFKQNNIDYQVFIKKYEIELLWNTLIYKLYRSQTNINLVEVDNEVKKFRENKSAEEIKKLKEDILNLKREKKLDLFSRSHFSSLENTVVIDFQ